MTLKTAHRLNGLILCLFIALHFANHLMGLGGLDLHLSVMDSLRQVYRVSFIEVGLFVLFAAQIILGLLLVIKRGRPKGIWAWLQVSSGLYIAFFLLQHLGTIGFMRLTQSGIDTNFYFAASVVLTKPMGWYFTFYYAFGIFAVFAHLAAALHFRARHSALPIVMLTAGLIMGIAIPLMLSGFLYPVDLPAEFQELLEASYPQWLISNR